MNNNNTFSMTRFGLLFKKDIQENWKKYLMGSLSVYGVILAFFVLKSIGMIQFDIYFYYEMRIFSYIAFFAGGFIFASTMMNPMNSKTKRISFMMNPSSALEKYLCRWLLVTIGYIIIFFLALWLANATWILIYSVKLPLADVHFIGLEYLIKGEDYYCLFRNTESAIVGFSLYLFSQSLFILGTTFWHKNSLIYTFSAFLIIVILYTLVNIGVASLLFPNGIDDLGYVLYINPKTKFSVISVVCIAFALFNWVLAFFRFRESEIIKRW